jgi:transposase
MVEETYEWLWLYAAVEPETGSCFVLLLPSVDGECFEIFLTELSKSALVEPDARVGVVLDNAPSHRSGQVRWPDGLVPMALPAYSPELNPAEQVFRQLRAWLSNRVFESLDTLSDALGAGLRQFWDKPDLLVRLTYYPWWRDAVNSIPSQSP